MSNSTSMFSKRNQRDQRSNIANLLNNETIADVTFVIGENETEFNVNRFPFAGISDVFAAMLYGNMAESKPNAKIIIPDIDSKGFIPVVQYAYCKDPQISKYNLVSIKNVCRKYQIHKLSEICDSNYKKFAAKTPQLWYSLFQDAVDYKFVLI